MKAVKNNRGITLISLVISIIMLLILSTITIMSLNGDDDQDIIEEAENTTIASEKIKIKEEVLFAVMQSIDIYKKIDLNKLNDLLKTNINELPANVTIDGYDFKINEDGTIEEIE